jgi:hypothetical protein
MKTVVTHELIFLPLRLLLAFRVRVFLGRDVRL